MIRKVKPGIVQVKNEIEYIRYCVRGIFEVAHPMVMNGSICKGSVMDSDADSVELATYRERAVRGDDFRTSSSADSERRRDAE